MSAAAETVSTGHGARPRTSPCAFRPACPCRCDWTPAGTGGHCGRELLSDRREAAHPPCRQLPRTLHGGEPVALTGRPGGTDEFLGRRGIRPWPCLDGIVGMPDPDNVDGAA